MIVAAGEWSSDISLRVRWGWLEVGWSFVRTLPPSLRMSMQWTLDFTALHRCYHPRDSMLLFPNRFPETSPGFVFGLLQTEGQSFGLVCLLSRSQSSKCRTWTT